MIGDEFIPLLNYSLEGSANVEVDGDSKFFEYTDIEKYNKVGFDYYVEVWDKSQLGLSTEHQVVKLPSIQTVRIHKTKYHKPPAGVRHSQVCSMRQGYYNATHKTCTEYYLLQELCVMIYKDEQTKKWDLDKHRYGKDSFGCAFNTHNEHNRIEKLDSKTDAMYVWYPFPINTKAYNKHLLPYKFRPAVLTIRHGGDPLMAALNVTSGGSLNFGNASDEKMARGISFMFISVFLIIIICYQFKQKGGFDCATYRTPEEDYVHRMQSRERMRLYEQRLEEESAEINPEDIEPVVDEEDWPKTRKVSY
mmetsp:Transcript_9019/g.13789  ORF Transcript_9019/g.13789 Transcript_9019/m.13789 type:complete len:306 (+) Transcript_9019:648-1565(+)